MIMKNHRNPLTYFSKHALKREKKRDHQQAFFSPLFRSALKQSLIRMFQFDVVKDNPTMASVLVVNYFLTFYFLREIYISSDQLFFHGFLLLILWMTSYFAQVSETIAIGRGKAQVDALKTLASATSTKRLLDPKNEANFQEIYSCDLQVGDYVLVQKGEIIPADGEIYSGAALIDESAVTGESAPVIRESGGDISAVTGGTTVVSDSLVMRVASKPGEGFLAKMIDLIEGAKRRKTPNEEALSIFLTGCTLIFIVVVAALRPIFDIRADQLAIGPQVLDVNPFLLGVIFICLIPTTISALLPAIGIAGMDRLMKLNIIAMSSRAIEAAGDTDTIMLDKTGTITLGNRQAVEFYPAPSVSLYEIAYAAYLSSIADDTAEGKSILKLALQQFPEIEKVTISSDYTHVPFSAKTRMSGVKTEHNSYFKGALDAIEGELKKKSPQNNPILSAVRANCERISMSGGTPLLVTHNDMILGAIFLKDVVKSGLKERFSLLRPMGLETVMITGDTPLTAAAISAEAGLDKFYGQVTPEKKLDIIKKYQAEGHIVAMTGDGSNDAPALAQADVALAMNSGTQAAREAANLIDLDSDPTKLIEIIHVGKDLLITRGALTTFNIANDIAKYFVLLPAIIASISPQIASYLSFIPLSSPKNACLASGLFNAWIIVLLIPLALKGVKTKIQSSDTMFRKNIMTWGLLGFFSPIVGIMLFDNLLYFFERLV